MSRQISNESKKIIMSNIIPILLILPTIRETQRNSRREAFNMSVKKNLLFVIHTK
jgi:vacuolar-type H+-ATPase subunit F/Vma7